MIISDVMRSLPPSLKSKFYIDGHFAPIKIFSPSEAAQVYRDYEKYVAKVGVGGKLEGDCRFRVHLVAKWAHNIVTHPVLVSAVKTVLDSNNILCWSSDLCIKPAGSEGEFRWHQDSTYSGLEPSGRVVTAWVALTPSKAHTGCLSVVSESQAEQLPHLTEPGDEVNMLAHKQFISSSQLSLLPGERVRLELEPGEASLHSWRSVHSSGPNTSDRERVGLAIRYMTDEVQNVKAVVRERASLVCGSGGMFWDLETPPSKDYGEKEMKQHRESLEKEKQNYFSGSDVETAQYK